MRLPAPSRRPQPSRPRPRRRGTRTISSIRFGRSGPPSDRGSGLVVFLSVFLAVVFAFASLRPTPAWAEDGSSPAKLDEARELYDAGSRRYALGEYAEAIELFRKAYDLTDAPELLYDIAQAYRLAGNCGRALETYRHFLRLDPSSSHRQDADAHIADLDRLCGSVAQAKPPTVIAPPPRVTAAPTRVPPAVEVKAASGRRLPWVLLGISVASGLIAGTLYVWNDGRYADWSAEDRRLAGVLQPGETLDGRTEQQNANDARLRSIHTADAFTIGFGALAVGAALGAAASAWWPTSNAPTVALHPRGVQLAWTLRLP